MDDFLYRGLIPALNLRFTYTLVTGVANQAVLAHDCDPVGAHILGRALCAGSLCAPLLTGDQRLTLRWNYTGALSSVVVDVGADSTLRGFVLPPRLQNVAGTEDELYGDNGSVAMIRSTTGRVVSTGTAEARLADPVRDLELCFSMSEQTETALSAMIGFTRNIEQPVDLCHGLMLQAMPGCDLEVFGRIRQRLGSETCRELLEQHPHIDNYLERIFQRLLAMEAADLSHWQLVAAPPPRWQCGCTRDKVAGVLRTIPLDECREIVAAGRDSRVQCQFCARQYSFSAEDLRRLCGLPEDPAG